MQQKSWLLSDTTFAGVMFHEATHFVLGTDDIVYDNPISPTHNRLKQLDPAKSL